MKIKRLPVAISLYFVLSGACYAAATIAHGVIRFEGSIIDPPCTTDINAQSRIALSNCPNATRTMVLKAHSVATSSAKAKVKVELLSDTTQGHYYDQQYRLVDDTGSPIRSGMFLITMSLP
ncbi:type 1 fimbrial protein [Pseudomonas sp. CCM 7893]|uniref:Type 1 fimbrial protein n=1 Tax=Pseudomonas spelaei TaxID=1055469 RepID=A0A6I3W8E5_9PSED|nr:type 1 fimbrial protein [Pseudomonas spelaei]MUF06505.1 type 1 fimbrial protein [Pseudomonas spelaei]